MIKVLQKTFRDLNRLPIDGVWEITDEAMQFQGREFDALQVNTDPVVPDSNFDSKSRQKIVAAGTVIFGQNFQDGQIRMQVEFDEVDHRSAAGIVLQHNPQTRDMLVFMVSGGSVPYEAGASGFQFKLQSWGSRPDQLHQQQSPNSDRTKIWTTLFEIGLGSNLRANQPYALEITVRGAIITLQVDGVEIGKHDLSSPSLPGFPCGVFCLSHSRINFKNIFVETNPPKAFVVMQFQTPEYEALFRDVIEPICKAEGIYAYRADSTHLPGLIIEDIKKQIAEARVIIAEITPQNPNVYYEVGYADALNKPVILIADRKEGLKPFDVRAYRTIFYDNSIGGKSQIENDLQTYLRSIMRNYE